MSSHRLSACIALLVAFTAGVCFAQKTPGSKFRLKPFRDSLKRRERLMKLRARRLRGAAARIRNKTGTSKSRQPLRRSRPRPTPPPPASDAKKEPDQPKTKRHLRPWPRWRRGRIDFDKADIRDVAKFISEITGINIILSSKARGGKLTIFSPSRVGRYEAYRAFLAALEVNNLTAVRAGRFLKIIPQREAKSMPTETYFADLKFKNGKRQYTLSRKLPNDDRMVTAIIHIKHADAKHINTVVSQLKSKNGFNIVYQPTNAIILADVAANVRRLLRIIRKLDISVGTRDRVWVIKIEHATASEILEKVKSIFTEKSGSARTTARPIRRPIRRRGKPRVTVPRTAGSAPPDEDVFTLSKILADDRTNQIILVSSEETYLQVLALVGRLDVKLSHDEGRVHVYYLQNADAEALSGVLSNLVSGSTSRRRTPTRTRTTRGRTTPARSRTSAPGASGVLFEGEIKVSADKATNSLVVVASPKDFDRLKRVIAKLDIRRRQVYVEAVIMEISMTKTRNLGLAFNAGTAVDVGGEQVPIFGGTTFGSLSSIILDPTVLTGLAVGVRGPPIGGTSGIFGGTSGTGGGIGLQLPAFGVILRALQSNSDVNVLSTPHILASDNEEAEIVVGQNVPFITGGGFGGFPGAGSGLAGLAGNLGGLAGGLGGLAGGLGGLTSGLGIGGFPNIQRQDVALSLKITPQVNASNFVKLKVEQEVQDLAGDDPLRGPTTTKRRAKTVVIIKDQQTVVLGGLIRDNFTEDISKVPVLGDIPILGYFFRDTVKRVEKRNLLLFLTPYIIKDPSDFRRIFKRKMKERQEFLERFASRTKEHKGHIDYRRRHGLLEEINQAVQHMEQDEKREAEALAEDARRKEKEKELRFVHGTEIRPTTPQVRVNFDDKPKKKRKPSVPPPDAEPPKNQNRGSLPPSSGKPSPKPGTVRDE